MSHGSRNVTVALVGSAERAFTPEAIDWERDLTIPWRERHKVNVTVDDDATLDQILRAAAREFGIAVPDYEHAFGFCAFYAEDHEAQFGGLRHDITLADEQGRAIWGVHEWRETSLRDLLYAAESGPFAGDPTRLYLVPIGPAGNGFFLGWSQLLEALRIAYNVVEVVAAAGGAAAVGKYALDHARARLQRGRGAIEEGYQDWSQRGANPLRLDRFLRERTWHSGDLAAALGCSEQLAEAILGSWGFAQSESGLWRLDEDEAARLIRKVHAEIATSAALRSPDPFEQTYRYRVEPLVRTGEPLPVPQPDFDDEEEDDEEGVEVELLDGKVIACACGSEDCQARLYLFRSWPPGGEGSRLRFRFEGYVDHFDFHPVALGVMLGHLADI